MFLRVKTHDAGRETLFFFLFFFNLNFFYFEHCVEMLCHMRDAAKDTSKMVKDVHLARLHRKTMAHSEPGEQKLIQAIANCTT